MAWEQHMTIAFKTLEINTSFCVELPLTSLWLIYLGFGNFKKNCGTLQHIFKIKLLHSYFVAHTLALSCHRGVRGIDS